MANEGHMIVARSRYIIAKKTPYFVTMVQTLSPVLAPGFGTMGVTDQGVLLIDPEWVKQHDPETVAGLLIHEVNHMLRDSHGRTRKLTGVVYDKRFPPTPEQQHLLYISNIASDLAINTDVLAMGFKLPSDGMFPARFDFPEGLTHEQYYELLLQKKEEQEKRKGDDQGNEQRPDGDNSGDGGGEPDLTQPQPGKCGSGQCGSGGGNPTEHEHEHQPDKNADVASATRTQAELEAAKRATAEAIKQHASSAKGAGTMPAGVLRLADEIASPPKVPWSKKLARAARHGVTAAAGNVFSRYDGVARRQSAVGYGMGRPILPRSRAFIPSVLFFIDTSGSMSETDLTSGAAECAGAARAAGGKVELFAVDTDLYPLGDVRNYNDVAKRLRGGGGTVFNKVFDLVEDRRKANKLPSVVVVATDGDAYGCPDEAPYGVKWIWLLTRRGATLPSNVTWGEVIELND